MRKLCIILIFSLGFVCTNAQTDKAISGSTMQNVLYRDFDNPLLVNIPGIDNTNIRITSSQATISKKGCIWYVCPNDSMNDNGIKIKIKELQLTISSNQNGKFVPVETKSYRVVDRPQPKAVLVCNGHTYGDKDTIPIAEIMADSVYLKIQDELLQDNGYTIEGFDVRRNGQMTHCDGAGLDLSIKNELETSSSSLYIALKNISVVYTDENKQTKKINIDDMYLFVQLSTQPKDN